MKGVLSYRDLKDGERFDFVVVGSGFGGSVSALRLAEKGYSVAVIEAGRHFRDHDFASSNWRLDRWLWAPRLLLFGIQKLTFLKDVLVLSGVGVGGGSLVYANTLLEPSDAFYDSQACRALAPDLRDRLRPHLETAKRMLGVVPAPRLFPADEALKAVAEEMGRADTFRPAQVGVFFGEAGVTVPDPYFGGEGPKRAGCLFCGACMVGCRHNAKNTLTKNYLPLAQKRGARVFSLSTVRRLEEGESGFRLTLKPSGWGRGEKRIAADHLVLSAGVLGTVRLLLEPSNRLTGLPACVGRGVRTNSETIVGSTARGGGTDYSQGLAIDAGFWPDKETHVEAVRYPAGSDAMALLSVRDKPRRLADALRSILPFGWARRSTILLVMQTVESRIRLRLSGWGLFLRVESQAEPGSPLPPRRVPVAAEVLRRFAARTDGMAQSSLPGALFGLSTTAHILGGAVMAPSPEEGVTDLYGRVHGVPKLWILDGSIVPANLGVNPSLTIAALAEHAMAQVPPKVTSPSG